MTMNSTPTSLPRPAANIPDLAAIELTYLRSTKPRGPDL